MKCPACSNLLTQKQVGKLTVDVCYGGCGGIWFDAFELQQVDEESESAGELLLHIECDERIHVDFTRKRDCPRCDGMKLQRHLFGPCSKVEVDECPNCGGYWLDAGELERIRAEKVLATAAASTRSTGIPMEVIRTLYRQRLQGRGGE
jgi:Zn-finger nucleic acid-binding protein